MSFVPERSYLTTAVLEMLRTGTGRPIGDAVTPEPEPGADTPVPYGILYPIDGGGFRGPMLEQPYDTVAFVYQVSVRGGHEDREQAEWMADRVRQVMIGRMAGDWLHELVVEVPAGGTPYHVIDRRPAGPPSGVDLTGTLAAAADRYVIEVTADG